MRQEERLSLILERLSQTGSVGVTGVATELGVSTASVRRDLQLLEEQHLLSRTHGGAVATRRLRAAAALQGRTPHDEKRRIAQAAAAGHRPLHRRLHGRHDDDRGGRALVERPGLTVVTNALNIASELALRPTSSSSSPAAWRAPESYELVGPIAEAGLEPT